MPKQRLDNVQQMLDGAIFAKSARVLDSRARRRNERDDLSALLRDRLDDVAVLDEHEPFFWLSEISSDALDSYYTRMHESSLLNYAHDATDGVSFQNSHRWGELALGRSLTGALERVETPKHDETQRVLSWFYTLAGLRLSDVATDDFIAGVRAGIVKDVSIGFSDAFYRCNICKRDLFDYDCPHIPGMKYMVEDERGVNVETLAYAWVENARLAEVSAVFDGANPSASILKAARMSHDGAIDERARRYLETQYRVALPDVGRSTFPAFQFVSAESKDSRARHSTESHIMYELSERVFKTLQERTQKDNADDAVEAMIAENARLAQSHGETVVERDEIRTALDVAIAERDAVLDELDALAGQVEELSPLANDGRTYRVDLVTDALAQGVRAIGEDFAGETYERILNGASLDVVKQMRDDWKRIADAKFARGRRTVEDVEDGEDTDERIVEDIPSAAFAA